MKSGRYSKFLLRCNHMQLWNQKLREIKKNDEYRRRQIRFYNFKVWMPLENRQDGIIVII